MVIDPAEFRFVVDRRPAEFDDESGLDDVIEFGVRRPPSRALVVVAVVLMVAGATAAIVLRHHNRGAGVASTTRPVVATVSPTGASVPVLGARVDPAVSDAVDMALAAGRLYVVSLTSLSAVDVQTGRVVADVVVGGLQDYETGPAYRLTVDEAAGQIWLLREDGARPAYALEFDAQTLHRGATVPIPGTIQGSAVLHGRVYLATSGGVRELSGTSAPLLRGVEGAADAIAADTVEDRLIVADAGSPTKVVALRPGAAEPAVTADLPVDKVSLAVVRGTIWAAGYGGGAAVLDRLDSHTLRVIGSAGAVVSELSPGADVVATGSRAFWVRAAPGDTRLWCLDGATGSVAQSWPDLPGPVASQNPPAPATSRIGLAYVAPIGAVSMLTLAGCAG